MNNHRLQSDESTNIIDGINSIEEAVAISEWRKNFQNLLKLFPKELILYRELSKVDDYYNTRKGGQELYKIKQNAASIEKTARAVLALKKWLTESGESAVRSKIMKRQKLHI